MRVPAYSCAPGKSIMASLPEADLKKYLKGKDDINAEDRVKILRLIENMTLGRNAVAYLTESMHGAGSPQAQRVQIRRRVDIEEKKDFAKKLSGVKERD